MLLGGLAGLGRLGRLGRLAGLSRLGRLAGLGRLGRLARLLAPEIRSICSSSELDLNRLRTGSPSELSDLNCPRAQSCLRAGTQLLSPRSLSLEPR
jgi:hypothetical protein